MVKQHKMIQSKVIVFMQKFSIPERIWKRLDCIYETLMNEDNVVTVFQIEEKKRVVIHWEDSNRNKIYDRKYCSSDLSCTKITKVIYLEVR